MTRDQKGFTLIEVAIATAILGVGLATLVAMNSRSIKDFRRDENLFRAALYARYLMSVTESVDVAPPLGKTSGKLYDRLAQLGYFRDGKPEREAEEKLVRPWTWEETVISIPVPPNEDSLRRDDLKVSWGDGANQSFLLTYYAKTEDSRRRTPESSSTASADPGEDPIDDEAPEESTDGSAETTE
jgi:prepilin-type N-terminal cleavage/methylation domain-containing protein